MLERFIIIIIIIHRLWSLDPWRYRNVYVIIIIIIVILIAIIIIIVVV